MRSFARSCSCMYDPSSRSLEHCGEKPFLWSSGPYASAIVSTGRLSVLARFWGKAPGPSEVYKQEIDGSSLRGPWLCLASGKKGWRPRLFYSQHASVPKKSPHHEGRVWTEWRDVLIQYPLDKNPSQNSESNQMLTEPVPTPH